MAKLREPTAKTAEPKAVIYLGVSIPGTALSFGSIYKNGYPEAIRTLMERIPEIRPLMVEVGKVASFKGDMKVKGSYANTLYSKLAEKIKGGKY